MFTGRGSQGCRAPKSLSAEDEDRLSTEQAFLYYFYQTEKEWIEDIVAWRRLVQQRLWTDEPRALKPEEEGAEPAERSSGCGIRTAGARQSRSRAGCQVNSSGDNSLTSGRLSTADRRCAELLSFAQRLAGPLATRFCPLQVLDAQEERRLVHTKWRPLPIQPRKYKNQ